MWLSKMFLSLVATFITITLLSTITACNYIEENFHVYDAAEEHPIANTELKFPLKWEGHELVRENFDGSHYFVNVPNNVITTECKMLAVYYCNSGSDTIQFGVKEIVQVQLDGIWYTLKGFLPPRNKPLELTPTIGLRSTTEVRHEIKFPNPLPSGRYRIVDNFYNERMQLGSYKIAYFWVIEPGAERPPESETTGDARLEDINLTVTSGYAVRRQVTDTDKSILFSIENISGKRYITTAAILDRCNDGEWERIPLADVNFGFGLQYGWSRWSIGILLHEPLEPGDYRAMLIMNEFNSNVDIFPQLMFSVISADDAPEPAWDAAQLIPSRITEISTSVTMTIKNNIITRENPELEIVLEVDRQYTYGEPFTIEVKLGNGWFEVPFVRAFFRDWGMGINENTPLEYRTIQRSFVGLIGIVPPGQYRIIKEFCIWEGSFLPTLVAREFAAAEFTVAEVLGG